VSLNILELSDGVFIQAIVRDITKRKESEEKFSNIVESSPMGIHLYQLEEDGRLVFIGANPAADKILGVDNDLFIGKTIEEAFPPLANTGTPDRYREVARSGKPWQTEQVDYEYGEIHGAFEVYAFQTAPGKMAAMFQDVTERKRTEDALRESESRYRRIFENVREIYFESTLDGDVIEVSPSVEDILKVRRKDVLEKNAVFMYSDPEARNRYIDTLLDQGSVTNYTVDMDGTSGLDNSDAHSRRGREVTEDSRVDAGHHGEQETAGAAAAGAEDGGGRNPGWRHSPRFQQYPHYDHRRHRPDTEPHRRG
jgi:PAS domain S-box-containing protein